MRNWTKAALIGIGLTGALFTAGCAYDDDYYGHRSGYYSSGDYHRYRDRDWDDHASRVRVCDDDGDSCHWEYRRR